MSLTNAQKELLARPFDPAEVKWKPQTVRGNRALLVAYVDARCVMDRLDAVFGVGGWETEYAQHGSGHSVVCTLSVCVGTLWVSHQDVGSESEQPDEGDRTKAAFSDALKRAAVHLGIGRYLYRLPHQWVDYDPQTRQVKAKPTLPAWALPKGEKPQPHADVKAEAPAAGTTPGGAAATITVEQFYALRDAVKGAGLSLPKVLAAYQVKRGSELPAEHYEDVMRRIKARSRDFLPDPAPDKGQEAQTEIDG